MTNKTDNVSRPSEIEEQPHHINLSNINTMPKEQYPKIDLEAMKNKAQEERTKNRKRLEGDLNTWNEVNRSLKRFDSMGVLPPWIKSNISLEDITSVDYTRDAFLRMSTKDIQNMRVNIEGHERGLMIFEVRKSPDGSPSNIVSISNDLEYRKGLNTPSPKDDTFQERARQIFEGMGYDMSSLEPCTTAGGYYSLRTTSHNVETRSFQLKGSPLGTRPDFRISLYSKDGTTNNAYVTGYEIFTGGIPKKAMSGFIEVRSYEDRLSQLKTSSQSRTNKGGWSKIHPESIRGAR